MVKKFTIILINIFIIISIISCESVFNYKEVEVVIEDLHPFEEISGEKVWYTLSYTNALGDISYKHINKNKRSTKILVPKNATIFVCAKPLNDFSPIATVINPGEEERVSLNYKEGYLVSFLQDLYLQNPKAVSSINYKKLYSLLNKKGLLSSFDKLVLARDILNGELDETSIFEIDQLQIELTQAIDGYWISENPDEGGFTISDSNYKRVSLSLGDGEHYYINFEKGYIMLIIVESKSKKYFVRIEDLNPEFI
jgi:hypothetical protein